MFWAIYLSEPGEDSNREDRDMETGCPRHGHDASRFHGDLGVANIMLNPPNC